jgi:hexosaminidase
LGAAFFFLAVVAASGRPAAAAQPAAPTVMGGVIPMPVSMTSTGGAFTLTSSTGILVEPGTPEVKSIGQYLADALKSSTGFPLQVSVKTGGRDNGNFSLTLAGGDSALGEEGYQLTVTADGATLAAYRPAGLFRGIQTIRQLLPPAVESATAQPGPWAIPTGLIRDYPRFPWRGAMLDVARHFFSVADVERYIDLLAYYKINRFHIHLTDDQGWRIEINAWPQLALYGGSTEVGGGAGGFFTQAEFSDLIAYAKSRYITIIPEIDMPGHVNAALASYAGLNPDGVAPALYTGTKVGFSSLCVTKGITYVFVEQVIRELAALNPGPYIHIGGDEAMSTSAADYAAFVSRIQQLILEQGMRMIGWGDIIRIDDPSPASLMQHWRGDMANLARKGAAAGVKVIMSPADKTYLDMKYDTATTLGLNWAGYIDVRDSYNWDPATAVKGLPESAVLGVEAPLWSETLQSIDDIEFMAFPRVIGLAELGWSPAAGRSWDEYKVRLGGHGPRLTALGVHFYPSAQVPWR